MLTGRIRELSIICIKEEHEEFPVACSMLAETSMCVGWTHGADQLPQHAPLH